MTKQEFLMTLRQALVSHNTENIDDIILDYEEHFNHALAQGKSEAEICTKLGSAESIALAYETESMISNIKNPEHPFKLQTALAILGRLIVITPFNFLVLFLPGALIFGLLIAGWSIALGFSSLALGALFFGAQANLFNISVWLSSAILFTSFGVLSLTVCISLFMFFATKNILLLAINYLQWNLKFILEK